MKFNRAMSALSRAAVVGSLVGSTLALSGCFTLAATGVVVGAMAANDRRTIGAQTEDTGIEVKAAAQLRQQLPDAGGIGVTSFNRKVLLTGQVLDERSRTEAAAIVGRLDNVRSVHNELQVAGRVSLGTSAADTSITARVKTMLIEARDIQATTIKVVTEAGVVYLMGIVTRPEGDRAAQVASRVSGVQRVVTVFEYVTADELARIERVSREGGQK
ncbi:BON domain-containing protein [Quisquiliibacterium transsilvanicum]|uniref:Osmotically-inducible protein OsmY n=1 Tax=Quisquiliibacterium transsilvanicum TaxID=1549638 RepID=A0A7W8M907_9BURK|nr:BON domain-containing protein [Quisquiliibacterium transsilvanicum]MBB5272561.1 osmotically-inducible protein OsmY [Quisquiliibacterium transsilvanicum]